MLILSFTEIFATEEFNNQFNIENFDRVAAPRWIRSLFAAVICKANRQSSIG